MPETRTIRVCPAVKGDVGGLSREAFMDALGLHAGCAVNVFDEGAALGTPAKLDAEALYLLKSSSLIVLALALADESHETQDANTTTNWPPTNYQAILFDIRPRRPQISAGLLFRFLVDRGDFGEALTSHDRHLGRATAHSPLDQEARSRMATTRHASSHLGRAVSARVLGTGLCSHQVRARTTLRAPHRRPGRPAAAASQWRLASTKTWMTPAARAAGWASQWAVPLLKSAGIIGVSMGAGDAVCQALQYGAVVDTRRTAVMGFIGATISGPLSHTWNVLLERRLPGTTNVIIAKKIMANSVYAFFFSLPIMFSAVTLLQRGEAGEKRTIQDAVDKVKRDLLPTFAAGTLYWPVFNFAVFKFVSANNRAVASSLIGVVWSVFISYKANSDTPSAASTEEMLPAAKGTPGTHDVVAAT